jgi:hypothetical protein
MGFLKDIFSAQKKQRAMIPEEYRGISGRVRWRKKVAADTNVSLDLAKELQEVAAEQQRLLSAGLPGEATIIAIQENVAETAGMPWHEIAMRVELPGHDTFTATRRVAVNLATVPDLKVGARVPVRVDPEDWTKVLIAKTLS